MKRKIVHIDREKCDGCGLCIDACHEGAIQLVDGKAELVSDVYCDGLGDCLGECPRGAITIEEREAAAYDDDAVKARLATMNEEPDKSTADSVAAATAVSGVGGGGCPGMSRLAWAGAGEATRKTDSRQPSALRQWPIQLKLVPVNAPYWKDADILLAADCVAHAYGGFHSELLDGRRLIIACPKLDKSTDEYVEKLAAILASNSVKTLTVAYMEVPCCHSLLRIAQAAVERSGRDIPLVPLRIGIQGDRQ